MPGQTRPRRSGPPARSWAFNGGPGNCPAKLDDEDDDFDEDELPSMEGRAIARPNRCWGGRTRRRQRAFNGGPGNCPAKPAKGAADAATATALQWRAGQLPGQTLVAGRGCCDGVQPSMEGRAIARPNRWW